MRVALFSASARAGDAIGKQLAGKVRYFVERGWAVRVYLASTAQLHPAIAPYCAAATSHPWRHPSERDFLRQCALLIAEYGVYYDLLNLLPLLARKKTRIVVDYHGVTPPELWPTAHRRRLAEAEKMRGIVWCADTVLVHSQFTAEELHRATKYPRERIRQVPCFVEGERFAVGGAALDVRGPLGLSDAAVLLFVGRLAANKRVPLLVEAVARLRESRPAVHAVIIGDNTDIYADEARVCQEIAERLRISDRIHLLGPKDEPTLAAWYRSADVLVLPSRHEGFCLPVVEAMACGLPVVAARAGALPETVGDAGVTFEPDDLEDLSRQLRRVLPAYDAPTPESASRSYRVALVAPRFGNDFVGGAETSLRTIATALRENGDYVEVFTTCNRHESNWANELPAGTAKLDGTLVHRFPVDPHDRERHLRALERIRRAKATASEEREYLRHSLNSSALARALAQRVEEFDAIIVGPYLFGLTFQVAQEFGARVLLLPCFHDEPLARMQVFRTTYTAVGGMLFHSPEEQAFAETALGINNPYAHVIGTWLPLQMLDASTVLHAAHPYLVYCGRYSPEKGVDRLLEYAERYATVHPERFRFAFVGEGSIQLSNAPWLVNHGFVNDTAKREIIRNAHALVQLSVNESLSLVALEAWAAGVPVIADRNCAVLRGQLQRSGGGRAVGDYAEFAAALDGLWHEPQRWRKAGAAGQHYVREHYASRAAFAGRLGAALASTRKSLRATMRQNGLRRAPLFHYEAWQQQFAEVIEQALDGNKKRGRRFSALEVSPLVQHKSAGADSGTVLVPVRVTNRGTLPALPCGPARGMIHCSVRDEVGRTCSVTCSPSPLPEIVTPGQSLVTVVPVEVPETPGAYTVAFQAGHAGRSQQPRPRAAAVTLELRIGAREAPADARDVGAIFASAAQQALAEAHALKTLPDDYRDITEGAFAKWKRLLKRKLLHNFRHAYVDVLSRQQSEFNEKVLAALCQLADGMAAMGHATAPEDRCGEIVRLNSVLSRERRRGRQLRRHCAQLARRLEALERTLERHREHKEVLS